MSDATEQRVHVRVTTLLPCKVQTETGEHTAVVLDISRGGARVETPKQITFVGEVISVVIRVPTLKEPIVATAEVLREEDRPHGTSLGVRFVSLEQKQGKALMQYIASIDQNAGGESRRHPRVMRRLEITLTTIADFRAVMRDVSKGGMGLTCDVPVVLDEAVKVDVRVPAMPHLVLPGKVVHIRSGAPGTFRVGIKFDEMLPETRELLAVFLNSLG